MSFGSGGAFIGFMKDGVAMETSEIVNYYLKGEKEFTIDNLGNSLAQVASKTAGNAVISSTAGKISTKVVKTNSGWFKPQKFISSFTGKYARKILRQTSVQGGLTSIYNIGKSIFKRFF